MTANRPNENAAKLREIRDKYMPKYLANVTPVTAGTSSGSWITDVDGNRFLDFAAGIGVVNSGHCHPVITDAVKEQIDKSFHTCFHIVMQESTIKLAEQLAEIAPGDFPKKVQFLNSGAEAVENIIKLVRLFTKRRGFMASEYGFHGRTIGALSLTSKARPHKVGIEPLMPEVYRMPYAYCYRCSLKLEYPSCSMACLEKVKEMFRTTVPAEAVGGIIVEPVLGESGVIIPPKEYLQGLRDLCDEHGMLLIFDEIQTAFGRVGEMFAADHFGVIPDIMPLAKALGNGLPVAAVVARSNIMDVPLPGALGSTYGGNPIMCAAGLAVLNVMKDEKLPQRSKDKGLEMLKHLSRLEESCEFVGEVRGIGMMIGIELVEDKDSKEPSKDLATAVIKGCTEAGLIVTRSGAFGNIVRLLPPLNTPDEDIEKGLEILDSVFEEVKKKR